MLGCDLINVLPPFLWPLETRQHVNVDEWLDVWGSLLHTSRSLEDLPLWLQYFPKILFQVINKSGKKPFLGLFSSNLPLPLNNFNRTLLACRKRNQIINYFRLSAIRKKESISRILRGNWNLCLRGFRNNNNNNNFFMILVPSLFLISSGWNHQKPSPMLLEL